VLEYHPMPSGDAPPTSINDCNNMAGKVPGNQIFSFQLFHLDDTSYAGSPISAFM